MGGTGRRAQVAFFVLLGVILLIGVVIAIYLIQQQRVQTHETPDQLYAGNPELAAEVGRMQQRVDDCLARDAAAAVEEFSDGLDAGSVEEAESLLADEISASFPNCFFQFNTEEGLTITDEGVPQVDVNLGPDAVSVTVRYAVEGTYADETYQLSSFDASYATRLLENLERAIALRQRFGSPGGPTSGGQQGQVTPGTEFIDENCYVDLYAYADQDVYADVQYHEDGTMTAVFTYLGDQSAPYQYTADLPACTPQEPGPARRFVTPQASTCAATATECPIALNIDELPESFNIMGPLYINPFSLTLDASDYAPGKYFAFATGTDSSGKEVSQLLVITIEA